MRRRPGMRSAERGLRIRPAGRVTAAPSRRVEESPDTAGQDAGASQAAKADGKWNRKETASGASPETPAVRVKRWGKSPPAIAATRRLAKPRPVQGEQGPLRGCPPRARVAAKRDGHPRQNPAYRPATEKALETGLSLSMPVSGEAVTDRFWRCASAQRLGRCPGGPRRDPLAVEFGAITWESMSVPLDGSALVPEGTLLWDDLDRDGAMCVGGDLGFRAAGT